jgi:hypothetical protein
MWYKSQKTAITTLMPYIGSKMLFVKGLFFILQNNGFSSIKLPWCKFPELKKVFLSEMLAAPPRAQSYDLELQDFKNLQRN